jgi:hypothetical protein
VPSVIPSSRPVRPRHCNDWTTAARHGRAPESQPRPPGEEEHARAPCAARVVPQQRKQQLAEEEPVRRGRRQLRVLQSARRPWHTARSFTVVDHARRIPTAATLTLAAHARPRAAPPAPGTLSGACLRADPRLRGRALQRFSRRRGAARFWPRRDTSTLPPTAFLHIQRRPAVEVKTAHAAPVGLVHRTRQKDGYPAVRHQEPAQQPVQR